MKYLLLVVVVVIVIWLMTRPRPPGRGSAERPRRRGDGLPTMIACAHCGVHLPQDEALLDAGSRRYCCEAHRVLGPH